MPRRFIGAFVLVAIIVFSAIVLTAKPAWYLRIRLPLLDQQTILVHAKNYHLPPALVAAVIDHESQFDAHAHSAAGALGLMQLTPATAHGIAERTGGGKFTTSDLYDPEINIRYGCWYLSHLHALYDKRPNDYTLSLAAYNAGQGKLRTWLKGRSARSFVTDDIPLAETRAYVEGVQESALEYAKAYPELHTTSQRVQTDHA